MIKAEIDRLVRTASLALLGLALVLANSAYPLIAAADPLPATQQPSGHHHHNHNGTGLALDLSSSTESIKVSNHLAARTASSSITVAGVQKVVQAGNLITPAEFAALLQVASGTQQTLTLDASNRAVSGTISLNLLPLNHISTLVIPTGVVAIDSSSRAALNMSGNLIANGVLLALPGGSTNSYSITAGLVQVGTGGSITTRLPVSLQNLLPMPSSPVSLSIFSLSNIINAGTISASGVVNLHAAGSIVNQATGNVMPVISGAQGVNIFSGTGAITNSGVITSALGNVNINGSVGHDLIVNNATGQIIASLGAINIRDQAFAASNITALTGGQLSAAAIRCFGGNGAVNIVADEIDGALHISGGSAHVMTHAGTLSIASLNLSGDPTLENTGGSIDLAANQPDGQTFSLPGEDLAVLASGSINGPLNLIDLSSTSGPSGNLTMVAGFDFTSNYTSGSGFTYTLGARSAYGGNINLGGVTINTSNNGIAASSQAGNVTLIAADGTMSGAYGTYNGNVTIGSIDASSHSGTAGNVLIIGQRAVTCNGPITTAAALNPGSVSINGGLPQPSGTIIFDSNGAVSGTGAFQCLADPGHPLVNMSINGSINNSYYFADNPGPSSPSTTTNPGADITLTTSGQLDLGAAVSVNASSQLILGSSGAGINLAGNNHLSSAHLILLDSAGAESIISLGSGSTFITAGDLVIVSENGSIDDLGNNIYMSPNGATILASLNNLSLAANTHIAAHDFVGLLSQQGSVTTSAGDQLLSSGDLGILGGGGISIQPGAVISGGALSVLSPTMGTLGPADIASPGCVVVVSGAGLTVQSSITANGGDLVFAAVGGDVNLDPQLAFVSNGGYLAIFASGIVTGGSDLFVSRAAGTPNFFTGGLIDIASGFSFHPDLIPLSLSSHSADMIPAHSQIMSAAAGLAQRLEAAHSNFVGPALDQAGYITDSTLVGDGVQLLNNEVNAGLFSPNKLGGGTINISNSTISIANGSFLIDSVGSSAQVSLPGSIFAVQSYDVAPPKMFDDYVQNIDTSFRIAEATLPQVDFAPTVTPVDQNQLQTVLRSSVTQALESASDKQGPCEQSVEGEQLADSTTSDEGEGNTPVASNQTVVEVGSSQQPTAANQPGPTDALSLPGYVRQEERQLGVPLSVRQRLSVPQPVIRITGNHSELTIFTTSSQVLTGVQSSKSETIALGEQGTAVSVANGGLVLHSGKLLADNGKQELEVTTRLGTVKIASNSTAEIIDEPGGAVHIMALGGGQGAVTVATRGIVRSIPLGPGEELILSDDHVYVATANAKDVSDSTPTIDRSSNQERNIVKTTFSLEQMLAKEDVIANRAIRLSGSKRGDLERFISHVNQAAKTQNPNFQLLKAPQAASALLDRTAGGPPRLLAKEGTLFRQTDCGAVELQLGAIFVASGQPLTIKTALGSIKTHGDAMTVVEFRKGKLRVKSLSGPNTVSLEAAGHQINLGPGREALLVSHRPSKAESLPADGVARRNLSANSLDKKLSIVTGDFSIISALISYDFLSPLLHPKSASNKQMRDRVFKLAAAVELATSARGRYYMQQREKAELPDWPFKPPLVAHGAGSQTTDSLAWSSY